VTWEEEPLNEGIQHGKRISLSFEAGLAGINRERAEQTESSFAAATDETTINGVQSFRDQQGNTVSVA